MIQAELNRIDPGLRGQFVHKAICGEGRVTAAYPSPRGQPSLTFHNDVVGAHVFEAIELIFRALDRDDVAWLDLFPTDRVKRRDHGRSGGPVAPAFDAPIGGQARAHALRRRRTERPLFDVVFTRPDQFNRSADRLRRQERVTQVILHQLGAAAETAPHGHHVQPNLLGFDAKGVRHGQGGEGLRLRTRPHFRAVIRHMRDAGHRFDLRVIRVFRQIGDVERPVGLGDRRVDVALLRPYGGFAGIIRHRFGGAVQRAFAAPLARWGIGRPFNIEREAAGEGLLHPFGDDRDAFRRRNDVEDARHGPDFVIIHGNDGFALDRSVGDRRIDHVRHADVDAEFSFAARLRRNVETADIFADKPEIFAFF